MYSTESEHWLYSSHDPLFAKAETRTICGPSSRSNSRCLFLFTPSNEMFQAPSVSPDITICGVILSLPKVQFNSSLWFEQFEFLGHIGCLRESTTCWRIPLPAVGNRDKGRGSNPFRPAKLFSSGSCVARTGWRLRRHRYQLRAVGPQLTPRKL